MQFHCLTDKEVIQVPPMQAAKCILVRPKKKVIDWRNPTNPRYSADPRYFY